MEHHALDRDLRLERLEQVPGDRLTLAVAVRREIELVDILHQRLQLGDRRLLVCRDHVQRLEVVVDVDTEPRPGLALVLRRNVGGAARQVTNVTARRLHDVVAPQIPRNLARLGRRLDDHQSSDRFSFCGRGGAGLGQRVSFGLDPPAACRLADGWGLVSFEVCTLCIAPFAHPNSRWAGIHHAIRRRCRP